jgi:hypothetical protein
MPNDYSELIRCLRILCSDYAEWLDAQVMLRCDAEALIQEAHVSALRQIGIRLAPTDPLAREFVRRTDASIPEPYQFVDTLHAARRLAPAFLRRLEKERDAEQERAKRDPVGTTRRDYLNSRAEIDPFCADANVAIDGSLLDIPKTQVRINAMDGSVINEF